MAVYKGDFQYVVQRQEKGKICFLSGLERKTLEADTSGLVQKHHRARMKENILTIAPGMYNIDNMTSAMSSVLNRPTSLLGTVLGGRTCKRGDIFTNGFQTPSPGTYDIPTTFPKFYKPAKAPFNSNKERKFILGPSYPGVGVYNVNLYKRKNIPYAHSFGGKKTLIPNVKMKCSPFNFDTCERCHKIPEGDYWYLETITNKNKKGKQGKLEWLYLCRECYDTERKERKVFTIADLRHFKKIRDCSQVHFHDGCKEKLYLTPPKEMEKLAKREAYLGMFF